MIKKNHTISNRIQERAIKTRKKKKILGVLK